MISGKKWSGSYLTVDSQGKVGAMSDDYEVLLRKRAWSAERWHTRRCK